MPNYKYQKGVYTLTRYEVEKDKYKYKLTYCNIKRVEGFENDDIIKTVYLDDFGYNAIVDLENPFETKDYKRSLESLSRTKRIIFEYALCNQWEYFCTFTISPKNFDRFDLKTFSKKFRVFINNYNRKLDNKLKYLLIPEKHKNGAWHMHGLISGIPPDDIKRFNYNDKLPKYIKNKISSGSFVGSWVSYSKNFGFNDIETIKDKERVSGYITKYITKDMLNSAEYIGQHLYYSSQGLKRAEKIDCFSVKNQHIDYTFENEFCKVKWFDDLEELSYFIDVKNYDVWGVIHE